ncbi:MAG: xylose isomerase [Gemmatimonadetes bacterium]|nr:xylose isomerase [Gemmatimonadota bacterium]
MLNSMADRDFERALDRHVEWALEHLDLKGGIFGKDVVGLSEPEANQARQLIDNRGLSVYCMSTTLFDEFVEAGEDTFRADHLAKLDSAIEVARVLQPHFVRLLAAKTRRRAELTDSVAYLAKEHTWLIELYREAIGRLVDAGQRVTVENECHDCIMSTPEEIHAFFDLTDGGDNFSFTWDVQNLWQMGTFPSLDVYEDLKDLISYYHVKGGRAEIEGGPLKWRSSLEDASWPVEEITSRVIADGIIPVICLNGSHGECKEGYDYESVTERDLIYMKHIAWLVSS